MKDILEAVPIDKYFELFKPGEGAEGGFIRVSMNYLYPDQVRVYIYVYIWRYLCI